tara:strand:+ start:626 stop:823 length:198 start_codon:yes stop_codon:yes gene_type:complete
MPHERHSFPEIAEKLGVSLATVHRMHREAIIKLRLALQRDPFIREWLIERKDEIEWNSDGSVYTD